MRASGDAVRAYGGVKNLGGNGIIMCKVHEDARVDL
ncbi:uncharacterized protein G2W53_004850 [Senna tora]|uniref:Uncharacterized protein n=1 Tax=Senna tora TaxID=362788 RepID=A0A835CKN6_9FABA|nr:uncharacterized protein G2W53_004850 [Senna tora]